MRKIIVMFILAILSIGASAQCFLTDTARLNSAYDELLKHSAEKKCQQAFFDAFPSCWARFINLYDYQDADHYDLTMYKLAPKHVGALQNKMTLIPDSVYCRKIVSIAVGAQLDADAPNYLQQLTHNTLSQRPAALLTFLSSLRTGIQFKFWEFYWSSLSHEKSQDAEFSKIYNQYHSDYPATMGIMADAYKYFCGGVDFSSDAICPADDPARCCCTSTAINREATTYKISTIVAGALLVVLVIIFFWQRKRLFRMVQSHRRKAVDKEEYEQTDNFIVDSEQELEALRVQKEAELDESKRVRLELRQRKLASIIQTAKLKCEERAIARNLLNESAICKRLGVADSLTEADWLQLDREVSDHFPAFRNRISEICKISDHEYQVDLLIKAGVPVGKMAALTFCSVSSISKCRQRQYQRAFGVKGKPEDWDTFVHCL